VSAPRCRRPARVRLGRPTFLPSLSDPLEPRGANKVSSSSRPSDSNERQNVYANFDGRRGHGAGGYDGRRGPGRPHGRHSPDGRGVKNQIGGPGWRGSRIGWVPGAGTPSPRHGRVSVAGALRGATTGGRPGQPFVIVHAWTCPTAVSQSRSGPRLITRRGRQERSAHAGPPPPGRRAVARRTDGAACSRNDHRATASGGRRRAPRTTGCGALAAPVVIERISGSAAGAPLPGVFVLRDRLLNVVLATAGRATQQTLFTNAWVDLQCRGFACCSGSASAYAVTGGGQPAGRLHSAALHPAPGRPDRLVLQAGCSCVCVFAMSVFWPYSATRSWRALRAGSLADRQVWTTWEGSPPPCSAPLWRALWPRSRPVIHESCALCRDGCECVLQIVARDHQFVCSLPSLDPRRPGSVWIVTRRIRPMRLW
jgi:hypothetical protein